MQPFVSTESLHDRNLRLAYYAERNRQHNAIPQSSRLHPWRRAVGRSLIQVGARLVPLADLRAIEVSRSQNC